MTDKPLTLKQWRRRAELAEAQLASIQEMRKFEHSMELDTHRKKAILIVALREVAEAVELAREVL